MSFVIGAALTNVDLLYLDMPRLPAPGEEIYTDKFSLQLGGGLPATLINLGRLGVSAKIVTELGDDFFSRFAAEEFDNNNVKPLNLYSKGAIPVNITSAVVLKEDRSFISYGKGKMDDNEQNALSFYKAATGSKICLMTTDGFVDVYRRLKSEGTIMVLDTGWDDELSFEKFNELISLADYYAPNRPEALKITGCSDVDEALKVLKKRFRRAVIKLDKDGCLGADENGSFFVKSAKCFKNIDSTGAGDAFLAGFCYGLFYDYSLLDCIEFGNITGGKAVTAPGALAAYVTENELLSLKKQIYLTGD